MVTVAVWHGTTGEHSEFSELLQACERNCRANEGETCGELCVAHRMLSDQRILDHLLWARRCVDMLRAEEFTCTSSSDPALSDSPSRWRGDE